MLRALVDEATQPNEEGLLWLDGEEARHAVRVRRGGVGDQIELVDGGGRRITGVISAIERHKRGDAVEVLVTEVCQEPIATPSLHVFTASPKGDRLAHMVEQLSQIGVATWTPIISERTVVDPRSAKVDRLRRIARESMKQCGRAWAMTIFDPSQINEAFATASSMDRVLLAERGSGSISDVAMAAWSGAVSSVAVFIGPEGGWTDSELEAAAGLGANVISIGPHVMRIEAAAVAAAAIVMALSSS